MTSHVTLGRRLTRITGVEVDVTDDGTDARLVRWADGPIVDRMRAHVATVLADLRRRDPGGLALVLRRDATPRAWAARAIAAQRKGALAQAVAAGAARRRGHPAAGARYAAGFGPEDHALLEYVQRLHDVTADPDSADHPDDEQGITHLLAAGESSTRTMARVLNATSALPPRPTLRLVPDCAGA